MEVLHNTSAEFKSRHVSVRGGACCCVHKHPYACDKTLAAA
jgi:hypothetical protein